MAPPLFFFFLTCTPRKGPLLPTVLVSSAVSRYANLPSAPGKPSARQRHKAFVFHKARGKKNGGPRADPSITLPHRATQAHRQGAGDRVRELLRSPGFSGFVQNRHPRRDYSWRLAASALPRACAAAGVIIEWHGQAERPAPVAQCPASGSATLLQELPRTQFPWGLNMAPRGETPEVCVSAPVPSVPVSPSISLLSRAGPNLPFLKAGGGVG